MSRIMERANVVARRFCSTQLVIGSNSRNVYTPRRAVLYVPGDDENKIKKVPSIRADCVVLDCEDGVAFNRKNAARETIYKVLNERCIPFAPSECCVRVNSPMYEDIAREDIKALFGLENLPTIVVPKIESVDEVKWFHDEVERNQKHSHKKFCLISMVESATGLLNLKDICKELHRLSSSSSFVHEAIIFGSDDFCADIGATRSVEALEVMTARQLAVMIAKSFRLQIIDLVHIDYKDLVSLKVYAEEGFRFGFTGKQVIHPTQVPVVQKAFTPSSDKMDWARELIKCFQEHQSTGKGAFTFRGSMIDKPLLLQAQNLVQLHDQLSKFHAQT